MTAQVRGTDREQNGHGMLDQGHQHGSGCQCRQTLAGMNLLLLGGISRGTALRWRIAQAPADYASQGRHVARRSIRLAAESYRGLPGPPVAFFMRVSCI